MFVVAVSFVFSYFVFICFCCAADVVTLEKTDEHYRLLYDVKGRFTLHRITKEEAQYKLCKVTQLSTAKKSSIGRNPFSTGQAAAIPYMITHDGRTIRYPSPEINIHDTVKVDIKTGAFTGHVKFEVGCLVCGLVLFLFFLYCDVMLVQLSTSLFICTLSRPPASAAPVL